MSIETTLSCDNCSTNLGTVHGTAKFSPEMRVYCDHKCAAEAAAKRQEAEREVEGELPGLPQSEFHEPAPAFHDPANGPTTKRRRRRRRAAAHA